MSSNALSFSHLNGFLARRIVGFLINFLWISFFRVFVFHGIVWWQHQHHERSHFSFPPVALLVIIMKIKLLSREKLYIFKFPTLHVFTVCACHNVTVDYCCYMRVKFDIMQITSFLYVDIWKYWKQANDSMS